MLKSSDSSDAEDILFEPVTRQEPSGVPSKVAEERPEMREGDAHPTHTEDVELEPETSKEPPIL